MNSAVALIVAGGTGSRMGTSLPKQYMSLGDKSVLQTTLDVFNGHPLITDVYVVIHAEAVEYFTQAVKNPRLDYILGGNTRAQSVLAGLQSIQELSAKNGQLPEFVLIHDAARPFVAVNTITDVITALDTHQGAAPALPVVDAMKQVDPANGELLGVADRKSFQILQTPQGFHFSPYLQALELSIIEQTQDDDMAIAMIAGLTCTTVAGNAQNYKLTTQQDMERAISSLQKTRTQTITGSGYDVHQICEGSTLSLCGVEIDCGFGLKGHSDADVGLHAATDAILGAIACGDIGDHFPPSDPKWKNASSGIFLKHALDLANQKKGQLIHLDITLICEAPKIKPHRENMRQKVSDLTGLELERISIKATTTERLGFTGRGEGIAVQALATMEIHT